MEDDGLQHVSYRRRHVTGPEQSEGPMNGTRGLRVLAFLSIAIGVGILSRPAWGFVAFGLLVLADAMMIKSPPPRPGDVVVRETETLES